jgi:hypothetical protein
MRKLPYLLLPPVPLTCVWLKPSTSPSESYPVVVYFSPGSVVSGLMLAKPNGTCAPGTVCPSLSTPTKGST